MNSTYFIQDLFPSNSHPILGKNLKDRLSEHLNLSSELLSITINGKLIDSNELYKNGVIRTSFKLIGGKGGFGSMLRAIGAQIEKTTNREACRDLSGRRLRDINEEKRLKNWLSQQKEREKEKEENKKKKIEKLLEEPKHEFKDESYQNERSNLSDKLYESLQQGLKRKQEVPSTSGMNKSKLLKKPRKKTLLDEEFDAINDTDDDSDDEKVIALAT